MASGPQLVRAVNSGQTVQADQPTQAGDPAQIYIAISEAPGIAPNKFIGDQYGNGLPMFPYFPAGGTVNFNIFFINAQPDFLGQITYYYRGFHHFINSEVTVQLRAGGGAHQIYAQSTSPGVELISDVPTATVTRVQAGGPFDTYEIQEVRFSNPTAIGDIEFSCDFPSSGRGSGMANRIGRLGKTRKIKIWYLGSGFNQPGLIEYGIMGGPILEGEPTTAVVCYRFDAAGNIDLGPVDWGSIAVAADYRYSPTVTILPNSTNSFRVEFGDHTLPGIQNHWIRPLDLIQIDGEGLGKYGWAVSLPLTASNFNDLWLPQNAPALLEVVVDGNVVAVHTITSQAPETSPRPVFVGVNQSTFDDGSPAYGTSHFLNWDGYRQGPELLDPILPAFYRNPASGYSVVNFELYVMQQATYAYPLYGDLIFVGGYKRYASGRLTIRLRAGGNNHVYATGIITSEILGPVVTATVTRLATGGQTVREIQRVRFSDPDARGELFATINPPSTMASNNGNPAWRTARSGLIEFFLPMMHNIWWYEGDPNVFEWNNEAVLNGDDYWYVPHNWPWGFSGGLHNWQRYNASGQPDAGSPGEWWAINDIPPGPDQDHYHLEKYLLAEMNNQITDPRTGINTYDNGFDLNFGTFSHWTDQNGWAYPLPLAEIDCSGFRKYGWNVVVPLPSNFNDLWLPANAPAYLELLIDGQLIAQHVVVRPPQPASAPTARFWAYPLVQAVGANIRFTDKSVREPWWWRWDFGDGNISTVQNPTHAYAESGLYTVSLTASNPAGSSTWTRTNYIRITGTAERPRRDEGRAPSRGVTRYLAVASEVNEGRDVVGK